MSRSPHFQRICLILIILLLLCLTGVAFGEEYSEELANPSFEIAQGPGFDWTATKLTKRDKQNCNKAYSGSCSFVMRGGRKVKSLKQELLVAGKAGDTFTLSGRAKVKRGRRKACSARLILHYASGTSKKTLRFSLKSRKWQYRQKQITATADFMKVSVILLCPRRAAVTTFDDFQLSSTLQDITLLTPYVNASDVSGIYQVYKDTHQGVDFSTTNILRS